MTHTYAILKISSEAYDEIHHKLKDAGYDHAFMDDGEIDMHGIAVAKDLDGDKSSPSMERCRACGYMRKDCECC